MKHKFSHGGVNIETKFELTEEQDSALRELIDSTIQGNEPVTLSGAAGTGKSALIGYLEDYMNQFSKSATFIYAAPTHAATVYLGLNIGKLPSTLSSILVSKFDKNRSKRELSGKFKSMMGPRTILVIDEASMISQEDFKDLVKLTKGQNIKLIFLGDKAQLPEVGPSTVKSISDVFTKIRQVNLTKVQRTQDNEILRVLGEVRRNADGYLPYTQNTQNLKYYDNDWDFFQAYLDKYKSEPEDTVYLSYRNSEVQNFNKRVREALINSNDGIVLGESIVGFGGYNNKQVFRGNLANSVKYKVVDLKRCGSELEILGFSNKASQIEFDLGQMTTHYLQLSPSDSIVLSWITEADMEKNNRKVSDIFKYIYHEKKAAMSDPRRWYKFFSNIAGWSEPLQEIDLGNSYVYNPNTDKMEIFNPRNKEHEELKKTFKELIIEKGIDYGYAITIHKSQGSTYKNVFFDASSTEWDTSPLMENDVQVGTVGNSLNYVGMSRASGELHIKHGTKIRSM